MIYSREQSIKVQVSELLKNLFECDVGVLSNNVSKQTLYKEVIKKMLNFLKEFVELIQKEPDYRYFTQLEYSTYLIM